MRVRTRPTWLVTWAVKGICRMAHFYAHLSYSDVLILKFCIATNPSLPFQPLHHLPTPLSPSHLWWRDGLVVNALD